MWDDGFPHLFRHAGYVCSCHEGLSKKQIAPYPLVMAVKEELETSVSC